MIRVLLVITTLLLCLANASFKTSRLINLRDRDDVPTQVDVKTPAEGASRKDTARMYRENKKLGVRKKFDMDLQALLGGQVDELMDELAKAGKLDDATRASLEAMKSQKVTLNLDKSGFSQRKAATKARKSYIALTKAVDIPRAQIMSKLAYAAGRAPDDAAAAAFAGQELKKIVGELEKAMKTASKVEARKMKLTLDFARRLKVVKATQDAVALKRGGQLFFGFRGTSKLRDLAVDAQIATNAKKMKRLDEAREFTKSVLKKFPQGYGPRLHFYGHSLGGFIAEGVRNAYPGAKLVTLHAGAPLSRFMKDGKVNAWGPRNAQAEEAYIKKHQIKRATSTRVVHYGDPVSGAVKNGDANIVQRGRRSMLNPLKNHRLGEVMGAQSRQVVQSHWLGDSDVIKTLRQTERQLVDTSITREARRKLRIAKARGRRAAQKSVKAAQKSAKAAFKAAKVASKVGMKAMPLLYIGVATADKAKDLRKFRDKLKKGEFDADSYEKNRWYSVPFDLLLGHGTTDGITSVIGSEYRLCRKAGGKKAACAASAPVVAVKELGTMFKELGLSVKDGLKKCDEENNCGAQLKSLGKAMASGVAKWGKELGNYAVESKERAMKWLKKCSIFASKSDRAECKARKAEEKKMKALARKSKKAALKARRDKIDAERREKKEEKEQVKRE